MGTENETNTPPAGTPPAPPPAAPPAPPAAKGGGITTAHDTDDAPVVKAAPAVTPPAPPKGEPKEVHVVGDGDVPDDAELLKFSKKDFDNRLKRAGKAELAKLFEAAGVKDRAELDAKFAKVKEAETAAEAARVAQLTEEQRLKEENARLKAEADGWKTKHEATVQAQQIGEVQQHYQKIAGEFIDPDYIEDVMPKLGKHLLSKYKEEELRDLPDDAVRTFFEDMVKAKPKLGKDGPPPAPLERKGLSNGAADKDGGGRAVPPKGQPAASDFRPKKGETPEQRRAMNDEIRQKLGYTF